MIPILRHALAALASAGVAVPAAAPAGAADLTSQQAISYVGRSATVCGTVVSASHSVKTRRQPTFLNLDAPYPQQVFTIVVWGSDRAKFGAPEVQYMGRRLCVTGTIQVHRGKAEIVATAPGQLDLR